VAPPNNHLNCDTMRSPWYQQCH